MTEPLEVQYRTREEGQEEGIYPLENDRRTRRHVSALEELCPALPVQASRTELGFGGLTSHTVSPLITD